MMDTEDINFINQNMITNNHNNEHNHNNEANIHITEHNNDNYGQNNQINEPNIQNNENTISNNENENSNDDNEEVEENPTYPQRKIYLLCIPTENELKQIVLYLLKRRNIIDIKGKIDEQGNYWIFIEFRSRTKLAYAQIWEYVF